MVKEERLKSTFLELVRIDSLSRKEADMMEYLKRTFDKLGYRYRMDDTGKRVNGNSGNLVVYIPGNRVQARTLMFSAHVDTVSPGEGIEPVVDGDRIYSRGETILAGDDKSGVAVLVELAHFISENDPTRGDIELVFTVCEEIGLRGARYLDTSLLSAEYGFVLDGDDVYSVTIMAPAAARFEARILGKEAHAGAAPEKGINAIQLAAKAIAKMPMGRIDDETTCNIGIIEGGRAPNIVPSEVKITAEVRSLDENKLNRVKDKMIDAMQKVVEGAHVKLDGKRFDARLELKSVNGYPSMNVSNGAHTVNLARNVIESWGKKFNTLAGGGGTDANLHNDNGVETIVLGTGMRQVHTVDEYIMFSDMVACCKLCIGIVNVNAAM